MSIGGFSPIMPSAAQDAKVHERKVDSQQRAAQAEGINGDDKESNATSEDRDADGRQAWRWFRHAPKPQDQDTKAPPDISGQTGNNLDLSG